MTITPTDCKRNLAHVAAILSILDRGATSDQVAESVAILSAPAASVQPQLVLVAAV